MTLNPILSNVTNRIINRSKGERDRYLARIDRAIGNGPVRNGMSCSNLAHVAAACSQTEKAALSDGVRGHIGIITAYNDMLSAHKPFEGYPDIIRQEAHRFGGTAQVAGGVPAMCDGVTQGQPGMELSLFSRDVIALSASVGLSHNAYDAALYLGVCDKIVPGLVMAAAAFGHLPTLFIPAGPMPSGLANDQKAKIRQLYATGEIGRKELLQAEMAAYHSPGTCTFYGTANSNQMLMEFMGLHLPGSSFVNPGTPLREALTRAAVRHALSITALGSNFIPVGHILDEKTFVNGIIGLLATGGSTNLTIHLIAMARAAGITITWEDMADLSNITPLMARVYPNGNADVNHFHAAGGLAFLIGDLLNHGLLHDDTLTIMGYGLNHYTKEPKLISGELIWESSEAKSLDPNILRSVSSPFQKTGGLQHLTGNLGNAVIKTSAVSEAHRIIEAPAKVFHSQQAVQSAFEAGELHQDCIVVVRFQGPKANGMPELHSLTPLLGVLQDLGYKVALITDGRMSGASGKVPAAIHLCPEAADGGPIALLKNDDILRLDAKEGRIEIINTPNFGERIAITTDLKDNQAGLAREFFSGFRGLVNSAEKGATAIIADG